jgi:pimeloyl-ACP methyl ester carboxylesterase
MNMTRFLNHDGERLAWLASAGDTGRTGLVWLGGFHSDMSGEKASALHAAAEAAGRSFLRFDYSGHGASSGSFASGIIGRWRSDALACIDQLTTGSLVLVGSSMGGWMALMAALARPERVRGLVLLAPAPDFTDRLMWAQMDESQRRDIMEKGAWIRPSDYDPEGYPITRHLIEEGRSWNLMDAEIPLSIPVRILHGGRDVDVPWAHSFELAELLASGDVVWSLIKDGDHRLSRPQDIARMIEAALGLADQVDG